jgi:hypothetical protein
VGEVKDGEMNGKGKITWSVGDVYEGEWKDGKRTGKGKCTWPDGSVYEGEFKGGNSHGQGTKTYRDGRRESGTWQHNKFMRQKMTQQNDPPDDDDIPGNSCHISFECKQVFKNLNHFNSKGRR